MSICLGNVRTCFSQPVTQACNLHTSGTTTQNNNKEQQQRTTTEENNREQQREQQQEIIKKFKFYSHDLTFCDAR